MAARIHKWDNAKAVLMLLVVWGHFLEPLTAEGYPTVYRSIFLFLYTFHMPAFIFIAGMFSKRTLSRDVFALHKLLPYVILSFLIKGFYFLLDCLRNHDIMPNSIFQLSNIAWFLFAMFVFYAVMYLLKEAQGKHVVMISLLVAVIAGYNSRVGDFFAVSRILVFFPFFALGYYTKRERLEEILAKKAVKIAAGIVLFGFAAAVIFAVEPLYQLRPLITGRNPYQQLGSYYYFGGLLRILYYGICTVVVLAFFALVPRRENRFLAFIGQHTLSIYFWHLPVTEAVYMFGIPALFERNLFVPVAMAGFALAAAALSCLFALPPFRTVTAFMMNLFTKYETKHIDN